MVFVVEEGGDGWLREEGRKYEESMEEGGEKSGENCEEWMEFRCIYRVSLCGDQGILNDQNALGLM